METNTETAVRGKKDLSVFDGLQVPVFIVGRDGKIVHSNDVFADMVGRKREQLEGVAITALSKVEESGVERALSGESACIETWATINNKKYFFELRLTPVYDSKGNVTGVIEALIDRTGQKLAIQAVHELIGKARAGDLSARAKVDASGDYRLLVDGINEMLDDFLNPLQVAGNYIERLSKGDVPEKITEEYCGTFNSMKNVINNLIDEMHILVDEVGVVIEMARDGDLSKRTNPDRTKGVYRKILRGINDALDALISPLKMAEEHIDRIGKGDIPDKITAEYQGDFNIIKTNLNNCIDEMNGITGEMVPLLQAVADGNLARRGNPDRSHGAYKNMILGMNILVDSIASSLADLTGCLDRMAVNDLTKKMSKDYPGVWDELKNAFNSVNAMLVHIQETSINISNGDLSDLEEFKRIGKRSENDALRPAFTKLMESIQHGPWLLATSPRGLTRASFREPTATSSTAWMLWSTRWPLL
jgi:PAS domain S-box-containing protein